MVLLAAWCAMRFGELAELRRSDIDVKNGVINVRRGVVRVAGERRFGCRARIAAVRGRWRTRRAGHSWGTAVPSDVRRLPAPADLFRAIATGNTGVCARMRLEYLGRQFSGGT
jgi:integrase